MSTSAHVRAGSGKRTVAVASLCVMATVIVALVPVPARAGTYVVNACAAANGVNHAWVPSQSSGLMASNSRCPSRDEGLATRSTSLAAHVDPFTYAQWRFDAPAGTSITAVDFEGDYDASQGWASVLDSEAGRIAGVATRPGSSASDHHPQGAPPRHYGINHSHWISDISICANGSGCATGDGHGHPYVTTKLYYAAVTVEDTGAPSVSAGGPVWSDGWHRGEQVLSVSTADASGIPVDFLTIDGQISGAGAGATPFSCDFTIARPCSDHSHSYSVNTSALSDGAHGLLVGTFDAAGNPASVSRTIYVDNNAPESPSSVGVGGGEGWRSSNSFDVSWVNPDQGNGSPIVAAHLQLCRADAPSSCAPEQRVAAANVQTAGGVAVPGVGDWNLRVGLEDQAGNYRPAQASVPVHLRFDDTRPGAAAPEPRGRWLSAAAAASHAEPVRLADGAYRPPSGIAGYSITTDGSDPDGTIEAGGEQATVSLAALPEGATQLKARAVSGAGVPSDGVGSTTIRIDRRIPAASVSGAPGPGSWQRQPVELRFSAADQPELSGMAPADAARAFDEGGYMTYDVDGGAPQHVRGAEAAAVLQSDGRHTVTYHATDAAGNDSAQRSVAVWIDRSAPEDVAFESQDPADPRRIEATAHDTTSGLAGGTIELRRRGTGAWHALRTSRSGDRLMAIADDGELGHAVYEFRVAAVDFAGNATTSSRARSGGILALRAPFRVDTVLRAGVATRRSRRIALRRPVRSCAIVRDRRTHRRRRSCRTLRSRTVRLGTSLSRSARVGFGQGVFVQGLLTTRAGVPVAHALARVEAAPAVPGGRFREVGMVRSDRNGALVYHLAAGPSRRVRVVYEGTARVLSARATLSAGTRAFTSLATDRSTARLHQRAVFTGRVAGGFIPANGKLIVMQAAVPHRGWVTFATARTNRGGAWRVGYRFHATRGLVVYRLRAIVPADGAYPYLEGVSRAVSIAVRG